MTASLSDILTTAKNLVTAVGTAFQNYLNAQGSASVSNISAAILVKQGAGRVATVVVTTAGSAPGSVYDGNSTASTTNKIYVIPNTVGVQVVNMPVNLGINVVPGTGQVVAISYS